ncbi:MAG: outer membrane beta-barrel protein [Candidatus Zixiibacteriota bacterium]
MRHWSQYNVLFLIAVATFMCALSAHADSDREGSLEVTVAGGISSPTDNYADVAAVGKAYVFGLGFTPRSMITLGFEYGFNSNDFVETSKYYVSKLLGETFRSGQFSTSRMGISAKFLSSGKPATMYARLAIAQWRNEIQINTDKSGYFGSEEYLGFVLGIGFQTSLLSAIGISGEFAYSGFDSRAVEQSTDIQILVGLQWVTHKKP